MAEAGVDIPSHTNAKLFGAMPGESLSPDEIARKVLANAPPGRQTAKEAALLDFVLLDEAGQIDTTVGDAYIESFEKARRVITAQL